MARFLLEAKAVSLSFSGTRILSNVSMGLHAGEFVVLLGPSGSGKSTLQKVMAGVLQPNEGRVLLRGQDVSGMSTATLARNVGSVPQDDIIHTSLALRPAMEYAARLRLPASADESAIQAAVDRVLNAVELTHRADVRISKLSGGQRKRASMGIELLQAPPILFLDEPTSGLDPDLEATTMKLLRKLADEGRAIMTTTHSTASLHMADLLLVIVQGHLAWLGESDRALRYFGVPDADLIFKALRNKKPAEWARAFASSKTAARMQNREAQREALA